MCYVFYYHPCVRQLPFRNGGLCDTWENAIVTKSKRWYVCVILARKSCGFRSRRRVLSRSHGRFDMFLEAGLEWGRWRVRFLEKMRSRLWKWLGCGLTKKQEMWFRNYMNAKHMYHESDTSKSPWRLYCTFEILPNYLLFFLMFWPPDLNGFSAHSMFVIVNGFWWQA